ncbi:MAG: hypothetical protein ABSA17_06345 [Rhabdochlamydiaceae bacterium]|jgi:hypothetical protein
MCKQAVATQSVQIGLLENETQEIIDIIDSHTLAADFFHWLSKGSFTQQIIYEKFYEGKYTRIIQYYIKDLVVYTGRGEFELNKFPMEAIQFLTSKKVAIDSTTPEFSKFKKEPVSKVSTDEYYTVISRLCNKDELAGFAWEIYELPRIVEIYSKLGDPLRYWRKK